MRRCSSTDSHARVAHATTASIEAESIGWIALGEGAYLHDDNATEVLVVAGRRGRRMGLPHWCTTVTMTLKITAVLSARPETFGVGSKEEYDYGQDGKGSPELLAKRAEARRIREEASVAIEAELAKDEYC